MAQFVFLMLTKPQPLAGQTEALVHLGNAERDAYACAIEHILEIYEDALRRFRPKERSILLGAHRADDCLEHQVKFSRLGELALLKFARMFTGLFWTFSGLQMISSPASLAFAAVDHHVAKQIVVPR